MNGLGSRGSQRSMRARRCPAPSDPEIRRAASGSATRHRPLSSPSENSIPPRQLAFCPFVSVGHDPHRIGRIGTELDERRSPLVVEEVEVPVVGDPGLAGEGKVRVPGGVEGGAAVLVTAPCLHPLLGLAHEDHTASSLGRGGELVGPGHELLGVAVTEAHDRHLRLGHEAVEVACHPVVVLGQQGRRRGWSVSRLARPGATGNGRGHPRRPVRADSRRPRAG